MKMTRRLAMETGLGTALSALSLSASRADDGLLFGLVEGAEDFWLATDAYIYGYPLVTVEMTVAKGQLPPVSGFWSVTMYDPKYFFVANPINRYSISPRQNLKTNADGSTDLYIQNQSPGADKESNWLPAPTGKFILMLRMYWPNEDPPSIIDGTWKPPAAKKVT